MNAIQPKSLLYICIVLMLVAPASIWLNIAYAKAIGHADGTSVRFISEYRRHDVRVTSVCAEGHVVLVAHSDVGQGGGLQMIQVQQNVGGELLPMTCDLNEYSPENE